MTARFRLSRASTAALAATGLALLLLAVSAAYLPSDAAGPRLSIYSTGDEGARGLYLWAQDLGYATESLEYRPFDLGRQEMLFALSPTTPYEDAELDKITRWVEAGGTLVHVADGSNKLLERLGLESAPVAGLGTTQVLASQPFPGATGAPLGGLHAVWQLKARDPAWARLVAGASNTPTAGVSRVLGRGRVYVFSAPGLLDNEGLRSPENRALAAHLVAGVRSGATVAFDEYHHGLTERGTLARRLATEPWGWAVLYALAAGFGFAVLAGRRFGPALPPVAIEPARTRGEYVRTLAALLRESGHRAWAGRQYAAQLKRSVGERFGVPSDQPAAAFAHSLARRAPAAADLATPLSALESAQIDDRGLVLAVQAAERVRNRLSPDLAQRSEL